MPNLRTPSDEPLRLGDFAQPPASHGIVPFWFWNCGMEPERVLSQVQAMAASGCGGFFIHARQGLTLPYLSDEWFARVRQAVQQAHRLGLQAWLYDEFPYPSGIAGGLLTANRPEFRARLLDQSTCDGVGGTSLRHEFPLGRLVSAVACPLGGADGERVLWHRAIDVRSALGVVLTREKFWRWPMAHIPTNSKRFMADQGRLVLAWSPPPGRWRVFVAVEVEQEGFKYFDCFFDPLHPEAAQEFLRLTHERYAREVGEYFGSTIPGIFTDETEPPSWSPHIEAELSRDMDVALLLPALSHDDHPRRREARIKFRACALKLFRERWEEPIARWCREHNLIWAAEKPTWRPAQFHVVAQPSTDAGHRRIGAPPEPPTSELRANHRAAMAAAEQIQTEEVRCECFHSLGWGATLQDQKWQIDWLAAQGVNRWTPHAFYATSSGLAKHDAAPSFFLETPAWKYFPLLAAYASRLGLALSRGRERARIALLHPTESLWLGGPGARRVRDEYEWLLNMLMAEHHPFHPVDALALTRAQARQGGLEIGRARYEVLLVPPLSHIEPDTQSAIAAALNAGLDVLMADWEVESDLDELAMHPNVTLIAGRDRWIEELDKRRVLSIADAHGRQIASVWAAWREVGEQHLLFVANTGGEEAEARVEVRADVAAWQKWSLEDGSATSVNSQLSQVKEGRLGFDLRLPPHASALLVASQNAAPSVPPPVPPQVLEALEATRREPRVLILPTEGDWDLELDRPNALRLNRWLIACGLGDWASPDRDDAGLAQVEALPLRFLDQVERKWKSACGREPGEMVWYRRWIECEIVPDDVRLLVEHGAIEGDWTAFVNGTRVEAQLFEPIGYNGGDKSAAAISPGLRRGPNLLAVRVENAPELGGLRTPLHLIGSFGLGGPDRRVLVELPRRAPFNDLAAAGLPHFSGAATYKKILAVPRETDAIELPGGFGDIAELKVGGQVLGPRA